MKAEQPRHSADGFTTWAEWESKRDYFLRRAKLFTPGFGPRYFALVDAAYAGLGRAAALKFKEALAQADDGAER